MKAMILAGGLSTRLYPLTKQVPKPLVPVAGEPNAVHLIRYLESYGYDEIAINVHYHAGMIVQALGDGSQFGVKLQYLHEKELMGSAGALKQLQPFFSDGTFVVVGCDDLTDLPLDELVALHKDRNAVATIGLVTRERVDQYGVVVTDENGKITGFQEKPAPGTEQSKAVNTGIYVFEPAIFEHIPADTFYDFGKQVFPSLQQAGAEFYGFAAPGAYWCDIGTPDEYRRATRDVLTGAFKIPGTTLNGNVWFGRDTVVAPDAVIVGPSVIGDRVHVESGARVEQSILWDGAKIGAGATLVGSIVGMNYNVAENESLRDVVVANE